MVVSVTSVSQIIEPKAVNFVQGTNGQFQSPYLLDQIEKQKAAIYESIDEVDLSEFAKNYLAFYENEAADFSVESLDSDNFSSPERLALLAYKIFKQADVPASEDEVTTDSYITSDELKNFIRKSDLYLSTVGVLDKGENADINKFAYYATKLNDIYNAVDTGGRSLNFREFTNVVLSKVDSTKIRDFERVLDKVISLLEDGVDRPVLFTAVV